jgi:alpha-1,2-mannosyltransferase
VNTGALEGETITASGPSGRSRPAQAPGVALAIVLWGVSLALLLAVFQTFFRHPWSMLDLRVYMWGGDLVRHSDDPYLFTYQRSELNFTYTPMAAGMFAVLSVISVHIMKALVTAASVASLAGVIWLTWGRLGYRRSPGRLSATLCVAAVALWLEPVWQTLSFGQVNLVLMLVIVADLCLPDSRWWKGIGIGLAAGFKLTPLIFIPYLLLTRRYRAAAVSAATFGLTIAGSLVVLPKAAEHYWLDGLFLNSSRVGNTHFVSNQSLNGALLRLFGTAATAQPYRLVTVAVVGVGGLLLAAWVSRRGEEMAGILICALTGLLVSPVSWSHHWVWVAPALVVLVDVATGARWRRDGRRWRWAGWLGVAALAAVFSGELWTMPAPAVPGFVMTWPEQLLGDLYVLTGLISLGVVAVLMVRAHRRKRLQPGEARRTLTAPVA